LRGDRGEFFTPRNVMTMVVEMVNPTIDEKVLDSSCGSRVIIMTTADSNDEDWVSGTLQGE
jgi:type I restriction enzyme M protein